MPLRQFHLKTILPLRGLMPDLKLILVKYEVKILFCLQIVNAQLVTLLHIWLAFHHKKINFKPIVAPGCHFESTSRLVLLQYQQGEIDRGWWGGGSAICQPISCSGPLKRNFQASKISQFGKTQPCILKLTFKSSLGL